MNSQLAINRHTPSAPIATFKHERLHRGFARDAFIDDARHDIGWIIARQSKVSPRLIVDARKLEIGLVGEGRVRFRRIGEMIAQDMVACA